MDSATVSVLRRPELVTTDGLTRPEAVRKLAVKAVFLLSEAGRKASLLAGGDGLASSRRSISRFPPIDSIWSSWIPMARRD